MQHTVSDFLRSQIDRFLHGDVEGYAHRFRYPCLAELPTGPAVLRRPENLIRPLTEYRERCLTMGLAAADLSVSCIELPRENRLRAWWRMRLRLADGIEDPGKDNLYYLRRDPETGRFHVEMAECWLPGFVIAPHHLA